MSASDNGLRSATIELSRCDLTKRRSPATSTPSPGAPAPGGSASASFRPEPATDEPEPQRVPLGSFDPRSSRARRTLIALAVVAVLLGGALGYGGASLWPKTYASRANILFSISQEKPTEFLREDRTITTQIVLMTSRTVLGPVAAANGLPIGELTEKVSAAVVPGSEVIEIEVRDGSPERGLALTQQVVASYTSVANSFQPANPARDYLEGELARVQDRLANARSASPASALAAEAASLAEREAGLADQLDSIAVDRLTTPRPETVVAPYTVTDPVSPSPVVGAVAGVLITLLMVAGAVLTVSARQRARAGDTP